MSEPRIKVLVEEELYPEAMFSWYCTGCYGMHYRTAKTIAEADKDGRAHLLSVHQRLRRQIHICTRCGLVGFCNHESETRS